MRKTVRYGLDLVLWSRLLNKRRAPIPLDLPASLLDKKNVIHDPPALFVSSPGSEFKHWEEGFQAVFATLFLNLQPPDVLSEIRYAHPAPSFNGIYLWDSAFTAQVWKHWDLQVAEDVNRAVVNLHEDGRLQHVVATFTESKYTQPPVLAWSLARLVEMQPHWPHEDLREKFFEPLAAYNRWLYRNRCHENGLFFWEHPYESGIDNSPGSARAMKANLQTQERWPLPISAPMSFCRTKPWPSWRNCCNWRTNDGNICDRLTSYGNA